MFALKFIDNNLKITDKEFAESWKALPKEYFD